MNICIDGVMLWVPGFDFLNKKFPVGPHQAFFLPRAQYINSIYSGHKQCGVSHVWDTWLKNNIIFDLQYVAQRYVLRW